MKKKTQLDLTGTKRMKTSKKQNRTQNFSDILTAHLQSMCSPAQHFGNFRTWHS